jgi:hypothetical protein
VVLTVFPSPPRTGTRTNRGRSEVRLDACPRLDQDLLHHRVQQPLEQPGSTAGHGALDPAPNTHQDLTGRRRRAHLTLSLQGRYAGLQRPRFLLDLGEAVRADRLGQPSGLEGPQIAFDGRAAFSEGCPCAGQLGLATGVLGVPSLLGTEGGRFEDRTVIECCQSLGNDRLLQRSGGKAFLVAACGAVSLPREAGVVAVDAAVAMRGCSDKAVTTTLAAQETGQQVAAGIGGLGAGGIRAFCEQELRPLEQLAVDDGLVAGLVPVTIERQLPDVCRVAQHAQDAVGRPPMSPTGELPGVVQLTADGGAVASAASES